MPPARGGRARRGREPAGVLGIGVEDFDAVGPAGGGTGDADEAAGEIGRVLETVEVGLFGFGDKDGRGQDAELADFQASGAAVGELDHEGELAGNRGEAFERAARGEAEAGRQGAVDETGGGDGHRAADGNGGGRRLRRVGQQKEGVEHSCLIGEMGRGFGGNCR